MKWQRMGGWEVKKYFPLGNHIKKNATSAKEATSGRVKKLLLSRSKLLLEPLKPNGRDEKTSSFLVGKPEKVLSE